MKAPEFKDILKWYRCLDIIHLHVSHPRPTSRHGRLKMRESNRPTKSPRLSCVGTDLGVEMGSEV